MRTTDSINEPIYVTKPFLPPLEEFIPYLQKIWASHNLTNNGPFHQELEQELCRYLGVKYISLFSNGTLALITALKVLNITGEVITTPFSFVATAHAMLWNNIKPVFVDIDKGTLNLNPDKIEAAITPRTTAILPVHVYGNPCDVIKLKEIADKNGLKVIYDAAHTFGVQLNNSAIVSFGDLSVLSFHAIKVFNTFEGGAVICHDESTKQQIDRFKNFGISDEVTVAGQGINAKMNEFQAALGMLQLKYVDRLIAKRRHIANIYRNELKEQPGIKFLNDIPGVKHNYSYFPVFVDTEKFGITRNDVYEEMKKNNIFGRRYFYPLISQLPAYRSLDSSQLGRMPVAEEVTNQVICLPIYPDLDDWSVIRICKIISGLKF